VLAREEAVQPQAVATGFVATQHRRVGGQAKPLLGQRDFLFERSRVAGADLGCRGDWPWPTVKPSFQSWLLSSKARYRVGGGFSVLV
jgi:hypothetical protein